MGFVIGKQVQPVESKVVGKAKYVKVAVESPVVEATPDIVEGESPMPVVGDAGMDAEEPMVIKKVSRRKSAGKK